MLFLQLFVSPTLFQNKKFLKINVRCNWNVNLLPPATSSLYEYLQKLKRKTLTHLKYSNPSDNRYVKNLDF